MNWRHNSTYLPPTMPPMSSLPPAAAPPEVRAAEVIAEALLEVAKSVDRLAEAVKNAAREDGCLAGASRHPPSGGRPT